MMGNKPMLDLLNADAHTKFGQIMSILSQDIEQKLTFDVTQGPKNH